MENETFGKRLKRILDEKAIDRKALAHDAGISVQAVGNYINDNRKPDCEVTAKIAKALGISADYLLNLSQTKSTDENIRSACVATGLSEVAVKRLKAETATDGYSVLSHLLESDKFYEAIEEISKAIDCQQSSFARFSEQLASEILNSFGIHSEEPGAAISNITLPNESFDEAMSILAQMATNITVLSREDTAKFHITEAQNHFRHAVEAII